MKGSVAGYVNLLVDALAEKEEILKLILLKCKDQEELFKKEGMTPEELDETIADKEELIERLSRLDDGFEQAFNAVEPEISANRAAYAIQIERMQQHIREVTSLSARVQAQEARNKELAKAKFSDIRKDIRSVKQSQRAVATYYNNVMSSGGDMMDSKQ